MGRRVSKITAAALFALVLSLSTPSAFAAQSRDDGPDFPTRIIRVIKHLAAHFGLIPASQDGLTSPKP